MVAVPDPDQRSPWQRDDWDAEPSTPASSSPEPTGAVAGPGVLSRTQVYLAAVIGAGLLAVGVFALATNDDERTAPDPGAIEETAAAGSSSQPNVAALPATDTTVTTDAAVATEDSASPTANPANPSALVGETTETLPGGGSIPTLVAGVEAQWAESTIVVPSPVDAIAPTEVVVLASSGLLHRVELPSGRVRTLDISPLGTAGAGLAVDDHAIVVFDPDTVYRLGDGEPVTSVELLEGVVAVQARPGTGQFIVTSPRVVETDAPVEWILRTDGGLERAVEEDLAEGLFWARTFSPTGAVLVNRPGGVYATSEAVTRRISTGDLVAAGARHYAVEECDETLQCRFSIVDWFTGEVRETALDSRTVFGFLDPSSRVSPDGGSIVYRDDSTGNGVRRIVEVSTGEGFDIGTPNRFVYPDSWVADGSGLMVEEPTLQFISRATREATTIGDFGDVAALGTRPLPLAGRP